MAQLVEYMPGKHKDLSSNPNTNKKKKKMFKVVDSAYYLDLIIAHCTHVLKCAIIPQNTQNYYVSIKNNIFKGWSPNVRAKNLFLLHLSSKQYFYSKCMIPQIHSRY